MKIATFIFLIGACILAIVFIINDYEPLVYISAVCGGIALSLYAGQSIRKTSVQKETIDAVTIDLNRGPRADLGGERQTPDIALESRLRQADERIAEATRRTQAWKNTIHEVLNKIHALLQEIKARRPAAAKSQAVMPEREALLRVIEDVDGMLSSLSSPPSETPQTNSTEATRRGISENKKLKALGALMREISEQSNVLAINAAIEAARIGKAGLGFGIIADEVQVLSSKIAGAANEVNSALDSRRKESLVQAKADATSRVEADGYKAVADELTQKVTSIMAKLSDLRAYIQKYVTLKESGPVEDDVAHSDHLIAGISAVEDALVKIADDGDTEISS